LLKGEDTSEKKAKGAVGRRRSRHKTQGVGKILAKQQEEITAILRGIFDGGGEKEGRFGGGEAMVGVG